MTLEKFRSFVLTQLNRKESDSPSPVKREVDACRKVLARYPDDQFCQKFLTYLELAQDSGLDGESIVSSCQDLALTRDLFWSAVEQRKIALWEQKRAPTLRIVRPPRILKMQLYPEYFKAIVDRRKPFEGRAYDPNSEKRYESVREGDQVIFNICPENSDWKEECQKLNLDPDRIMRLTVKNVFFAPRVHWMYGLTDKVGADFQPMVPGEKLCLGLQRAAVYYQFPGYKDKIDEFGFVGIEVENPEIIQ